MAERKRAPRRGRKGGRVELEVFWMGGVEERVFRVWW
jgi:hypothetical protein